MRDDHCPLLNGQNHSPVLNGQITIRTFKFGVAGGELEDDGERS